MAMSDDLIIALITAIAGIVGILIKSVVDNKKTNEKIDEVGRYVLVAKEQVTNEHGTNLRDDLDVIRDEVRAGFNEIRQEIATIRGDVTQIREMDNLDRKEHTSLWDAIRSVGGRKE